MRLYRDQERPLRQARREAEVLSAPTNRVRVCRRLQHHGQDCPIVRQSRAYADMLSVVQTNSAQAIESRENILEQGLVRNQFEREPCHVPEAAKCLHALNVALLVGLFAQKEELKRRRGCDSSRELDIGWDPWKIEGVVVDHVAKLSWKLEE